MTTPGWYPDPYDATALQYHDGRQWTGQRQWPARSARRTRAPLIIAAVVVLVAALLGVGWVVLGRGGAQRPTFAGKKIANAGQVLGQGEAAVMSAVTRRHGLQNSDTRCYFAQAADPPKGSVRTDVDAALRCGPVLFVDGDTTKPYLSLPLSGAATQDGQVTLTVAATPSPRDPGAVPSILLLSRPDARKPPPASGGLAVPVPPPADKGLLTVADLGATIVGDAPTTAVVASRIGGVKLIKLGRIDRFGTGDDARSAPDGQQLIAFQVGDAQGQSGSGVASNKLFVSVDKGTDKPLPVAGIGQSVVVAAPTSVRSAELVLLDEGLDQRVSLLDGKPLVTNVAVLTRHNLSAPVAVNLTVTLRLRSGGASATSTETIRATRARLEWWSGTTHASSGSKAFLLFDLTLTSADVVGHFGVDTGWLTLAPSGLAPIKARNLAGGADQIFNVFEVPASFTTGTVTIAGSSSAAGITATVENPQTFAVNIPAG